MLTLTAPVGQSVLRNAIRLQNNYVEHRQSSDGSIRKVYVNEKHRYGQMPSLSRTGILLLIYLHFSEPDEKGFIRMFDAEGAAAFLGCHVRTVQNNLRRLVEGGYILMSPGLCPYHYSINLPGYSSYFLPSDKGGRGYILFTQELLRGFIAQSDISSLRLAVRSVLFSTDNRTSTGALPEKTYREIKRDLPAYCSRKLIRDILHRPAFNEIFAVSDTKYTMAVRLRDEYDPASAAGKLRADCAKRVQDRVALLNKDLSKKERLTLTENDIRDISSIADRYAVTHILEAISKLFTTYIYQGRHPKSIGAIVRVYARSAASSAA